MLHSLNWGNVPSWLGAISIILAFAVFHRDRIRAERQQVERLGVWSEPKYSTDPPLPRIAHLNFSIRNASNLPLSVDQIKLDYATEWSVPVEGRPNSGTIVPGGDKNRPTPWPDYPLVKPGDTIEDSLDVFVLDRAPKGATALSKVTVTIRRIDVTDNAGRRWQIRPKHRKPIRRIRFYHLVANPPPQPHSWYRPEYNYFHYAVRRPRLVATRMLEQHKRRSQPFVHAAEYLEHMKEIDRAFDWADVAARKESESGGTSSPPD
jgi:hypothetical protein